jgi:tripartite-type tricarboxylate transporter receptor subunit TctC
MPRLIQIAFILLAGFLPASRAPAADPVEDFYRGKSVTLTIGNEVGGGYDQYARTLARHLGRFIPGNPSIIPKNVPAADGVAAAYRLSNVAPRDGSEIGAFHRDIPILPLIGQMQDIEFNAQKLGWIGSLNRETSICMSWHTSQIKTFQDTFDHDFVVGVTAAGASLDTFEAPLMNVFHSKLKVIAGYHGGQNVDLAMERGEIEGRCGVSWSSLIVRNADWFRDKKINILLQFGLKRHDLPDVPLPQDLVQSAQDKEALEFLQIPTLIGRPYLAPPGVPPERLAALRAAFNAMIKDPEFLADVATQRMEIQLVTGEDIANVIARAYGASPQVITRARELMRMPNRS